MSWMSLTAPRTPAPRVTDLGIVVLVVHQPISIRLGGVLVYDRSRSTQVVPIWFLGGQVHLRDGRRDRSSTPQSVPFGNRHALIPSQAASGRIQRPAVPRR